MTNSETERQRLAQRYTEMSDVALLELAAEAASLTDVARDALRAELSSRRIQFDDAGSSSSHDFGQSSSPESGADEHSGPLETVCRYRDLPDALIAKSILDSADLDSFLADETMVRFSWFYSNLIGGVSLMVRPEDLHEARQLLQEANLAGSADSETSTNKMGDATE
ncbi:MAG TPA: DUF2007 domain-containing protein [Candidatus Acidoferrum sp.]|nr:DUF2007 domain-containing protein [Candidatus Acidoferrum sp.]